MLSKVSDALTQFNANANWYADRSVALLRLEAIEFLLSQRAQDLEDAGSSLRYESLAAMRTDIIERYGLRAVRANGRRRRVGVAFTDGGVQ